MNNVITIISITLLSLRTPARSKQANGIIRKKPYGLLNYLANTKLYLPLTSQKQHFRSIAQKRMKMKKHFEK